MRNMKIDSSWKERKNTLSNLTMAKLIENTIKEEGNTKEAYYCAIAVLNEIL